MSTSSNRNSSAVSATDSEAASFFICMLALLTRSSNHRVVLSNRGTLLGLRSDRRESI